MPVSDVQRMLLQLLAANRSEDSYLAGSIPLHFAPTSRRVSRDVDLFNDSEARVATAFAADEQTLHANGFTVTVRVRQPGFVQARVTHDSGSTIVDWARESAWRFMPSVRRERSGFELHPVDLAVNKALAVAGRAEPRDYLDILDINREILPLAALCWAAPGKDPGFNPISLLELLKRRGRHRPEDFADLALASPPDLESLKGEWLAAIDRAELELLAPPAAERGCLYFSPSQQRFVWPVPDRRDAVPHFGRPGGVLPSVYRTDPLLDDLNRLPPMQPG